MCICHQRGSVELQLKHEDTEASADRLLCPSWEAQEHLRGLDRPLFVLSISGRAGGVKGCIMERSSGFKELEFSS